MSYSINVIGDVGWEHYGVFADGVMISEHDTYAEARKEIDSLTETE